MVNMIFMGPPGSGKGTQSIKLAESMKIPTISTGDALRREVENLSEIGIIAKDFMKSGKLVPDEVVVDIIRNRLSQKDCDNGFIVDGFPRNIKQAYIFNEMLESLNKEINIVFNFKIEDDILMKRILGRYACSKCGAIYNSHFKTTEIEGMCDICESNSFESRSDDNEVSIKKRLEVYHDSADDLIEYYEKKNLLYSIDALKSVSSISGRLVEIVENIQKEFN